MPVHRNTVPSAGDFLDRGGHAVHAAMNLPDPVDEPEIPRLSWQLIISAIVCTASPLVFGLMWIHNVFAG